MKNSKDRKTLKGYFKKGCIPTEEQFAAWIDSVPNIVEDGQIVRTADGWSFYPEGNKPLQICLHEATDTCAAWTLCLTPEKGLAVKNALGETIVELKQEGALRLPDEKPEKESTTVPEPPPAPAPETAECDYVTVAADKNWYDLAVMEKKEFKMFDVFLLLYDPNSGVCKATRITSYCMNAIECYVESPQKHWWGWSGGVKLRWLVKNGKLCLQVRSKRKLTTGKIFCKIR